MEQKLELTQEWDKVFPLSEKVNHKKVTFETQYGLTLAADLYEPKDAEGKLAAIAVSGPFGATKEQSSGLYAMRMAERGFVTLAFDPSYNGESSGSPRRTASPDINTEDFMAAVDYLPRTSWQLSIICRSWRTSMPRRLASSAYADGEASPSMLPLQIPVSRQPLRVRCTT